MMNSVRSFFAFALLFSSCTTEEPIPTYTFSISASPIEGGKMIVFPQSPNYKEGEVVTLTPEPNENWVFKQWEGDGNGNSSPLPVVMNSNKSILGVFIKRDYPLTITLEGEGTVSEEIVTSPSGREYPHGTTVKLTPVPKQEWVFDSWEGDLSGSETPKTVTVDKEKNVTARFKEIPKFYLHPNGVTCMCPNTKPGDKEIINGIQYESVDNTLLRQRLRDGVDWSKLCTSLVNDMSKLFYNFDIYGCFENWDVSKVVNMNEMFYEAYFSDEYDCPNDIGKYWNPKSVKYMSRMFSKSSFYQPIGNWDVRSVENMNGMFDGALGFNQNISNWCVPNIKTEPENFSTNSPLTAQNKPKWGTCPD